MQVGLVGVFGELDEDGVFGVHAGPVDGTQVLETTLHGEEGPDEREGGGSIASLEGELVPGTLDLRIVQLADQQVLVQPGTHSRVHVFQVGQEVFHEQHLHCREEGAVHRSVDVLFPSQVVIGQLHGLFVNWSVQGRHYRRHASHRQPQRPVHGRDVQEVSLAVVFEEGLKGCGVDAGIFESLDVEPEESDHLIMGDKGGEVGEEEVALFIRHGGEGVVRVVVLELRLQRRVSAVEAEHCHVRLHVRQPDLALHFFEVFSEDQSRNGPFCKHSEALVEPKVLPGLHGDGVAKPGVHNLVDGDEDLLAVLGDDGGGGKGHEGVLHSAERERRGQHQHSVVAPHVLTEYLFGLVQVAVQVLKALGRLLHERRFGDHSCPLTDFAVLQVSHGQGNEVGGDLDQLGEGVGGETILLGGTLLDSTHLDLELGRHSYVSTVSDLVGGGVLEGGQGTAVDALTLGEQVGQYLPRSLRWLQPVDALLGGVVQSEVVDHQVEGLPLLGRLVQLQGQPVAQGVVGLVF